MTRTPPSRRSRHPSTARRPLAPALAVLSLLAAAACSDPFGPEEDAFREARAKWQAAALSDYEFDYRLQCFCGPVATRPVTIQVEGGEVAAVLFRDGPGQATEGELELFPTIEDLFDRIERTLEKEPEAFEATYDSEVGYPTFVSADIAFHIADEEFAFEVTRLAPPALP